MKELTTKEQYEYFEETFNKFNTTLLNQSDDDIEYIIFEDIINNVVSFLHPIVIGKLLEEKYINKEVYDLCCDFRKLFLELEEKSLRSATEVRESKDWLDLVKLADEIKSKLWR